MTDDDQEEEGKEEGEAVKKVVIDYQPPVPRPTSSRTEGKEEGEAVKKVVIDYQPPAPAPERQGYFWDDVDAWPFVVLGALVWFGAWFFYMALTGGGWWWGYGWDFGSIWTYATILYAVGLYWLFAGLVYSLLVD